MDMAFQYSAQNGLCSADEAAKASAHLAKLGMPAIADMKHLLGSPETLLSHMRQDKKNEAGAVTLILTRAIGDSFVQKDTAEADILTFLQSMKDTYYG